MEVEQIEELNRQQIELNKFISLENNFNVADIKNITGIDLVYMYGDGQEEAVCCACTIDFNTGELLEQQSVAGEINIPYKSGYLTFRELPLVEKVMEKLSIKPDMLMFDGNGYLHHRHMGIATHASILLGIPSIGVAKSYMKIYEKEYTAPELKRGEYTNIIIQDEIYGRALVTRDGNKPIFVSCGNHIDLDTATEITLKLCDNSSKVPKPTRLADIATHYERRKILCLI